MLEATVQWRRTEKPECYDPDYISPEVSSTFATGILITRSAGGGGCLGTGKRRRNYRGPV
jgi:hypothetical protein